MASRGDNTIRGKYRISAHLIVLLVAIFTGSKVQAESLNVTLEELSAAIEALPGEQDALKRMVLQKIQAELSAADLSFGAGELLFSETATDLTSGSGCNRTEVREVSTSVTLNADTGVALSLVSLNEPITLAIKLDASLRLDGRARQVYGFRLNGCRTIGTDSFSFSAESEVHLFLQLTLRLDPELDPATRQLLLRPAISLTGSLTRQSVHADVDDSLLRNVLERILEDEIEEALDQDAVINAVDRLERDLIRRLDTKLDEGVLIVDLPDPSDEQVNQLYELLSDNGDFSLSLGYLRGRRLELLAALILGDNDKVEELFSGAAMCEAAGLLQVPLPHPTLYAIDEEGCSSAWIPDISVVDGSEAVRQTLDQTTWFMDSSCQAAVAFQVTSTQEYCARAFDRQRLGNAASQVDELGQWTLSPGTRFDIGATPLIDHTQPLTQRVEYKSVATDMGECSLEMRIHSPVALDQSGADEALRTGLRPLIAFHGGSWQWRMSGALGLEAFAGPMVDQGFVVFEPFYRLIGDLEGNVECNNATLDNVLDDASDAMSWVVENAVRYGAVGKPVLFGQSAGGHLAGVLAVERAPEVAAAVLFYAPVDFSDFLQRLTNGEIDAEAGREILETVIGQTLENLDSQTLSQSALFQRNTLPARIAANSESNRFPPFFLLQGQNDLVLPWQQSLRMCNALAGRSIDAELPVSAPGGDLRQIVNCGFDESQLHLIKEGEHSLDLCIADELCLAGGPASAALTQDSVEQMLDWVERTGLVQDDEAGGTAATDINAESSESSPENDTTGTTSTGGGGISPAILAWLLVFTHLAAQRRNPLSSGSAAH